MRFSIRLNNDLTLKEYVGLAQAAERAGFDHFWVSNDLFLRSAPTILSAVAAATERIQIGTCILNPYTLNPGEIAMLAATLDELSGCRFNLGLAAGAADFLKWVGIPQVKPLAAMRETITAIRALLSGGPGRTAGEFLRWSREAYLRFQAPRVTPIYLGALSPGMLRLACAGTPEEVAQQTQLLSEAGASRVEFGAPHGLNEEEGLRLLGEAVLPRLQLGWPEIDFPTCAGILWRRRWLIALQSAIPLLPAKQRKNHPADWMETDSRVACPDPACRLIMQIERISNRTLRHDDVSPIAWETIEKKE